MGIVNQTEEEEIEYFDVDTCFGPAETMDFKLRHDQERWKVRWDAVLSVHRKRQKSNQQ